MKAISGLVITYNEEKNIGPCIESLMRVCNEVVVVDSLSSDRTAAIAESMGAKVIAQPFLGDGPQRSAGLPHCTHEWVLNLDADERLDEDMVAAIGALKVEEADCDAYEFRRKNYLGSRWIRYADWYPDYVRRLFNKTRTDFKPVKVHSKIESEKSIKLNAHVIHYTYDSLEQMTAKLNSYSSWSAQELVKRNKKVSSLAPFLHGTFSFVKFYFIKLGFLEGLDGLTICLVKSVASYLKYAKVLEIYDKQKR